MELLSRNWRVEGDEATGRHGDTLPIPNLLRVYPSPTHIRMGKVFSIHTLPISSGVDLGNGDGYPTATRIKISFQDQQYRYETLLLLLLLLLDTIPHRYGLFFAAMGQGLHQVDWACPLAQVLKAKALDGRCSAGLCGFTSMYKCSSRMCAATAWCALSIVGVKIQLTCHNVTPLYTFFADLLTLACKPDGWIALSAEYFSLNYNFGITV